jgi:hypothetical protein
MPTGSTAFGFIFVPSFEWFDVSDWVLPCKFDELVKSHHLGRHSKKLQMQGAQIFRNEA